MAQPSNPANVGWVAGDHRIGSVALASDGTMTVTYDPNASNATPSPLILRPDQKVYRSYLEMVGELSPGESKPLYSYAGIVQMNDDRSLTVQWNGSSAPGQPIVEPWRQFIKPDDPLYQETIMRAGGLNPGQTKGIP